MRNKPKVPRLTPEVDTSTPSTSRPVTPDNGLEHLDFNLPGRIRSGGANPLSPEGAVEGSSGRTVHMEPAVTVSVTPLSDIAPVTHTAPVSPLQPYVQNPGRELSAPDAAGLKSYKGRQFAEVTGDHAESGTQTVMVTFDDAMKAWRAKLPSERNPSGPPVYRIADSITWSLRKPIEHYEPLQHTSSYAADSRGYYAVHREITNRFEMGDGSYYESKVTHRDIGFAFKDKDGKLIRVDPLQARGDMSVP